MQEVVHLSQEELEAGLETIRQSPKDGGELVLIVRRPQSNEREILATGELDPRVGLVGDNWCERASADDPDTQLNVMNARAAALVAIEPDRRSLAGDQLFIDIDLSDDNLPPGSRLSIGAAVIEVTAVPHTGCKKFTQRFGVDAVKFVNTGTGKELHLRGINARVVQAGTIQAGDVARKV
jgi:MOSC domain-containing protein YiiM